MHVVEEIILYVSLYVVIQIITLNSKETMVSLNTILSSLVHSFPIYTRKCFIFFFCSCYLFRIYISIFQQHAHSKIFLFTNIYLSVMFNILVIMKCFYFSMICQSCFLFDCVYRCSRQLSPGLHFTVSVSL